MTKENVDSLDDEVAVAYMDENGQVKYFTTTIRNLLGMKKVG